MSDTTEIKKQRAAHFDRLQKALEEGLQAISQARTVEEAEQARLRARARLEQLNRQFESIFPDVSAEATSTTGNPDDHDAVCDSPAG